MCVCMCVCVHGPTQCHRGPNYEAYLTDKSLFREVPPEEKGSNVQEERCAHHATQ